MSKNNKVNDLEKLSKVQAKKYINHSETIKFTDFQKEIVAGKENGRFCTEYKGYTNMKTPTPPIDNDQISKIFEMLYELKSQNEIRNQKDAERDKKIEQILIDQQQIKADQQEIKANQIKNNERLDFLEKRDIDRDQKIDLIYQNQQEIKANQIKNNERLNFLEKRDIDRDQKIDLIYQNQQEIILTLKDHSQRLDLVEQNIIQINKRISVLENYHQNPQDK
ncbi:hypothetical protein ACW95P_02905 [Candidatus Mycoplasma pogonae]